MSLLTKQERKNLEPEARKALRAERRAANPKKGIRININWDGLLAKAKDLMLDIAGDLDVPGPTRMNEVCDTLASEADDYLTFQNLGIIGVILESIDGPIIGAIFGALIKPQIQKLYEQMADNGEI